MKFLPMATARDNRVAGNPGEIDMTRRADIVLIALRQILHATGMNARALARRTGLTAAQLLVLQVVAETESTTPKEVARRSGVSQATITALVDKLEARGYVTRQRGQQDRRLILIVATSAGRALLKTAPDPQRDAFVSRFEAMADWEQSMLIAALERLGGLLDAENVEALPVPEEAVSGRH